MRPGWLHGLSKGETTSMHCFYPAELVNGQLKDLQERHEGMAIELRNTKSESAAAREDVKALKVCHHPHAQHCYAPCSVHSCRGYLHTARVRLRNS